MNGSCGVFYTVRPRVFHAPLGGCGFPTAPPNIYVTHLNFFKDKALGFTNLGIFLFLYILGPVAAQLRIYWTNEAERCTRIILAHQKVQRFHTF